MHYSFMLSASVWMLVHGPYKKDYLHIFKCVSFWWHINSSKLEYWDNVNRFDHTFWVTVVIPTDRPQSVSNRCENEVFVRRFCVVTLLFGFFCGCRCFCHMTESKFFLLFPHWQRFAKDWTSYAQQIFHIWIFESCMKITHASYKHEFHINVRLYMCQN